MSGKVNIIAQVAEVRRELALRRNVYPGLIRSGKLRQTEAELCTARMEAVLATLMFCQQHESDIRDYIAMKRESGVTE